MATASGRLLWSGIRGDLSLRALYADLGYDTNGVRGAGEYPEMIPMKGFLTNAIALMGAIGALASGAAASDDPGNIGPRGQYRGPTPSI